MLSPEEIADQRELLQAHRRTLDHYLRQVASLGSAYTPPGVINGIYEARDNIKRIRDHLSACNVSVEHRPTDEQSSAEELPIRIVPYQIPEIPHYYIERPEAQRKLQHALLAETGSALITLYGMSGTGKSTLAAHVARDIKETFPDGILWGNLDNLNPADQFLSFLGTLDSTWHHSAPSEKTNLRDVFWQRMHDRNTRLLIVFDNVKDTRQLLELLPHDIKTTNQCRIVAIGLNRFAAPSLSAHEQHMSYFSEKEAETLFRTQLGTEHFKLYLHQLHEISQKLEFVPQLLVAAAKEFVDRKISPNMYLLRLRKGEDQLDKVVNAIEEGLALTIQALTSEQAELFEAIGAFGDGDWTAAMLAAITLQSPARVRQILAVLSEHDLVKIIGGDRYHTNTLVRDFARKCFEKRPEYNRRAAYNLLARYCLDLAQNPDAALAGNTDLHRVPGQAFDHTDPAFVRAFCAGLLPEVSHFRRVLDWAISDKAWDVLLRFASVSSLELHIQLIANSFEIQKSATMATFVEPIIWQHGERIEFQTQSYGHSANWRVRSCPPDKQPVKPSVSKAQVLYSQSIPPNEAITCELTLTILVGQIIDGLLDTMCLMNAQWIGVRAGGLICKYVSIISGCFLACDMSQSIWVGCDAQHVTMRGSSLSYALLQDVKFHGADLREMNLTGAVLDNVDMRGANLRDANMVGTMLKDVDLRGADLRSVNLSGAMLKDVDLRDADLRGANLTAAQADGVELNGCRIDNVTWAGVRPHRFMLEDSALLKEIEQAAAQPVDAVVKHISRRWRPTAALDRLTNRKTDKINHTTSAPSDPVLPDFSNADLRGVSLQSRVLTQYILRGADLRAAHLREVILENADLSDASLRAADLQNANLAKSNLRGADLRTAILNRANLQQADLTKAILRSAQLVQANLHGAQLKGADLRFANCSAVNLSNAGLQDADLTNADLRRARLHDANFCDAQLHSANLAEAIFTDANLADASCIGANFRDATIAEKQLAQAERLDRATLPAGERVEVFDGVGDITISSQTGLRFAHFDGIFEQLDLHGRDMRGVHLDGMFKRIMLAGADLAYGRLRGKFSRINCSTANLTFGRLSGTFFDVNFRSANFQGASLSNANLVNVNLTGALNLSDDQLRHAKRLRGTKLPDGSPYKGQFDLTGDREDALKANINPDDPGAMERFLDGSRPKFVPPPSSS